MSSISNIEGVGKKSDRFNVDPRCIVIQDGWNPRVDYGDIEELKNSIVANGVIEPLRVKRGGDNNNQAVLINGHRRLAATLLAISEGHDIATVPCIFERSGIVESEAMFTALITNQAPPLPVDPLDLMNRKSAIDAYNQEQREKDRALGIASAALSAAGERVERLREELAEAEQELEDKKAEMEALPTPEKFKSTAEIEAEIAGINEVNAQVAANQKRSEALSLAQESRREADRLTSAITALDDKKSAQLAAAKFPVPGLGFDENGVTFNGVPFVQSSDAEKLRVSVAMGLAMNPELKVVLIRDGSKLDEDNLRLVAEMAAEAGAQVWMERVGEGDECSVIIEDGAVKQEALL